MDDMSMSVRLRKRKKLDVPGMIVAVLTVMLSWFIGLSWIIKPLREGVASQLDWGQIVVFVLIILVPLALISALIVGKKWVVVDVPPVSLRVGTQRVSLGETTALWSELEVVSSFTSVSEQSAMTLRLGEGEPTTIEASLGAIRWLSDVLNHFQNQGHGENRDIPEALEAMRRTPDKS